MKPLTRYTNECFESWGDFFSRMVEDEDGEFDTLDAAIDAARRTE